MLLTRETHIAVAMLVACAQAGDRRLQTHEAAAETGASRAHASKIAYMLRRAGFVTSVRGRYGGIKLALPARSISLGTVLRFMQPKSMPELQTGSRSLNPLDAVIASSWTSFAQVVDRFTIADLSAGRRPPATACHDCRLLTHAQPDGAIAIQ